MKIKLKTLMAGPDGVFQPGDVRDVSREQAIALVAGGYAEAFEPLHEQPVETAVMTPPERAVQRTPAKKGR